MALQPGVDLGLLYNTPPSLSIPCSVSPFVYSHLSQVRGHVIQPSHFWSSSSSSCMQLSVHLFRNCGAYHYISHDNDNGDEVMTMTRLIWWCTEMNRQESVLENSVGVQRSFAFRDWEQQKDFQNNLWEFKPYVTWLCVVRGSSSRSFEGTESSWTPLWELQVSQLYTEDASIWYEG